MPTPVVTAAAPQVAPYPGFESSYPKAFPLPKRVSGKRFTIGCQNPVGAGNETTKTFCDGVAAEASALKMRYIGLEDEFVGREQRRFIVKQQYDFIKPSPGAAGCVLPRCQPLEVTKKGTMAALPDSMVDGTFGEAGAVRANPTFAGSRVKIVADLTISAANPLALRRASMVPGDDRYYGFQLSNGVLVNNYLTFARFEADGGILADGGTSPCDFRLVALDGGSVTFSSVSGVWDSYTYVGCSDGGTLEKDSRCFPKRYWVPGTDAGTTNVLYPMSCADFQLK